MDATLAPPPVLADEELERLYDQDGQFEVEFGQRKELPPMSTYGEFFTSNLYGEIRQFVLERRLGHAAIESLVRIPTAGDRTRGRRPDILYVSYERLPADSVPLRGTLSFVPDLVVEVVSPNDFGEDAAEKARSYIADGVRVVWLVFPIGRLTLVFDEGGGVRAVNATGPLDGGAVLPGFQVRLSDLLPPPAADN